MGFRLLLLGGWVFASACYKPSFRDCAISCDTATGCPSGLTCDMTAHMCALGPRCGAGTNDSGPGDGARNADASIDADPNGDNDTDGIKNGSDNCIDAANPDQADEDSDGVGDACDACPIFPGTTDSDGDGLPDSCDPHPMKNGSAVIADAIIRFEPFNSGMGPNAIATGTGVSAGNGAAFIQAGGGHEGYLTYPAAPAGRGITVFTLVRYANVPASTAGAGPLTEVTSYNAALGRAAGFGCEVEVASPTNELNTFETDNQSFGSPVLINEPSITNPQRLSIGADNGQSSTLLCRRLFSDTVTANAGAAPTFDVGLYAHGVNTSFDYVLVVATTP